MPDKLFGDLRDRVPELATVSDDDLVITLGNNYPGLLENPDNRELADRYKELTEGSGLMSSTLRGFGAGVFDLSSQAYSIAQAATSAVGLDETAELFGEDAREARKIADEVAGPGADRFLPKVSRAATSVVPVVAAGPMAIPMAGAQSFGSTFREAQDSYIAQGDSEEEAASKSFIPAMQSGVVTAVVTLGGGALASKLKVSDIEQVNKIFKSTDVKQAIKGVEELGKAQSKVRGLGRTAVGAAVEGAEEGLDEFVSAYWVAAKSYDPNLTMEDALSRAVEAFYIGATIGAPINLVQEMARIDHIKQTSPAVAQKLFQNLQQQSQAQEAPLETPDRKFAEANKDVPMGGKRPVSELPVDPVQPEVPQSQMDAMPDASLYDLEVDPEDVAAAEQQAQPEPQSQGDMFPSPDLNEDAIDDLAERRVLVDYGLETETPGEFDVTQNFTPAQQALFAESVRQYSGFYKQYQNNPEKLRQVIDQPQPSSTEPTAPSVPTTAEPSVSREEIGDGQEAEAAPAVDPELEPSVNSLVQLAASPGELTRKGFYYLKKGGKSNWRVNDDGTVSFKQPPTGSSKADRAAYASLRNQIKATAAKTGRTEAEVLNSSMQAAFDRKLSQKVDRKLGEELTEAKRRKESEVVRPLMEGNETTVDDAISRLEQNVGRPGSIIKLPVDSKGNLLADAVRGLPGEYDGFISYVNAVQQAESELGVKLAGRLYEPVVVKKTGGVHNAAKIPPSKWTSVEEIAEQLGDDVSTSDAWDQLSNSLTSRTAIATGTDAESVAMQQMQEEADTLEREERRQPSEDIMYEDDLDPENVTEEGSPFAAMPPSVVNGVSITGNADRNSVDLVNRIKSILPTIQKKLGGAKIRSIEITRKYPTAPAYSRVRNGDFGSVGLHPENALLLIDSGQSSLEKLVTEEVIHNYVGLAIYNDWRNSGTSESFRDYYGNMMRSVFDEMTDAEINETVFYYRGLEGDARNFRDDPVSVAEEYLRIVLQRELTGQISEELFSDRKVRKGKTGLSRVLDIISRFFNGITRGFMGKSPTIRSLRKRVKKIMRDPRTTFPAIDRNIESEIAAASQMGFDFGSAQTDAEQSAREDAEPKPENGFNNNEGFFLAHEMARSTVDYFGGGKTMPQFTPEQIRELKQKAEQGDWGQRFYYLSQLDLVDQATRLSGKGAEAIPASIAPYIQKQDRVDVSLPNVVSEELYKEVHKIVNRNPQLTDESKDFALYYIWSRMMNDARRFILKNRGAGESDTEIIFKAGVPGRQNFNIKGRAYQFLTNYFKLDGRLKEKIAGSSQGLVSLDEKLTDAEGESFTRYDFEVAPNPMDFDPRRAILNREVYEILQKTIGSLDARLRDMLLFGMEDNFRYGWKNRYAKTRGISRAAATQNWYDVQARIISEISGGALSEFDAVRLRKAVKNLPADTRNAVLKAVDFKQEMAAEQGDPTVARQEMRRAITETALLRLADKWNITAAAMPNAKRQALNSAKEYDVKPDPNAKVVDNDTRTEEVKKRMDAADSDLQDWMSSLSEKVKNIFEGLKMGARTYRYLSPSKYGDVIEVLRQFEANPEFSTAMAVDLLRRITSDLNPKQMDMFKRVLILRDLKRSVDEGMYQNKPLPFGFRSALDVEQNLADLEQALSDPANQTIVDALERRRLVMDDLTDQMKEKKLLPDDIAGGEDYFHRSVLQYRNNANNPDLNSPSDLRTGRAGFQRKRRGSDKDYSTNYFASEMEVLSQMFSQLATVDTLGQLKNLTDKKPQLVKEAKQQNMIELAVAGVPADQLFQPFNRKIAMAISGLKKLINDGNLTYDYSRYQDVAEALTNDAGHPDFFGFLKHLASTNSGGEMFANMIFKATRQKEEALRSVLGDRYKTWRDLANESDELTIWQPEKGNYLYRGTTVADQLLVDWYKNANPGDQQVITPEQLRNQLILGGRKPEWVVPTDVAKQLNDLKPEDNKSGFIWTSANAGKQLLGKWKYWTLFNPASVLKYEINNMTGDFDVAFAYDPEIITKHAKKAYEELWEYHKNKKPISDDVRELIRRGVIGSGWQLQDLGEVTTDVAYKALFDDFSNQLGEKSGWLKRITNGYTRNVSQLNQIREDTLRVAAYRYFLDRIKSGKTTFGASKPSELAMIAKPEDKAAKMSRELLGDYGALSHNGKFIRKYMIPFWSWMEINAPRYVRMMRNTYLEGDTDAAKRVATTAGRRAAVGGVAKAAKFALLAQTLPLFVTLFNRAMVEAGFVDDEDLKAIEARNQQHLLLYSPEDGEVKSIRLQGALTDALEWFGLSSAYNTAADVVTTDLNLSDAVEDYFTTGEFWKASTQRIASGLNPFVKTPIEVMFKQRIYPDWTKPAPVRDRTQYALQSLDIGPVSSIASLAYDLYKDFPSRGITGAGGLGDSLIKSVAYSTDTGEAAYNYIKAKEYKFYSEKEGERAGFTTNDKSDALYYYNRAKTYGDKRSADRWKEEYIKLGGTTSGLKRSATSREPLAKVKKYRREFLDSLTEVEKQLLQTAQSWHKKQTK